ncbi:anti-repressor SinI family protein [Virgibacillus oceani]|uniref:Sin domain-containing protein n=1 Tax=Virgibacillus oceani TaxID=1479511 RepID=A0A917HM29_9BACI|nr:anti-repressor SinI family protein [Virgibacillus oceani]GGG83115.1 hypothetical protein GCM10011398_30860 [Virgibacillus oceani]
MRNLLGRVIDEEWVVLIKEAKDLGLSMEEVREFLQKKANQLGHED